MSKTYKDASHITIKEIERQQQRHAKDIIQPRINGEVNPNFIAQQGTRNLNISEHDVERMNKIDHRLGEKLSERRREQQGYF